MASMDHADSCAAVRQAIRTRESLAGASFGAHLRACPACAALADDEASLGRTLADALHADHGESAGSGENAGYGENAETAPHLSLADIDAMYAELEPSLRAPVGPVEWVRQRSTRTRALTLAGVGACLVALGGLGLIRVDIAVYPLPRLLAAAAALVAAVLAAGSVVIRPRHRRPVPGWLLGVLAGFAVVTPAVIAALPPAHHDHPMAMLGTGADLLPRALGCFIFGMVFALALVGAAWLVERSGLRRRAAWVLSLVGAGALGNLVLVLHCPMVAPVHKLAGHASISAVLLAAAGLGAWRLVATGNRSAAEALGKAFG